MAEQQPRYEEFRFASDVDVDVIDRAAEAAHHNRLYVSTGTGDSVEQKLAVYATIPEDVDPTRTPVWRPTAFSDDPGRPGHFDAALARALNRPVLTVNNPGIDHAEWRDVSIGDAYKLTDLQHEDLRRGSFRRVARATLHALKGAAEEHGLPEGLIIASSSMGAAIAGGALGEASHVGVDIKGVALEEGVNYIPAESGLGFAKRFLGEGAYNQGYLDQNPMRRKQDPYDLDEKREPLLSKEANMDWVKRVAASGKANFAYARALTKGKWLEDANLTGDGDHELAKNDIPFFLSRGSESKLSSEEGDRLVEERLRAKGFQVIKSAVYDTHHHPYTMTIQAYVKAVNALELDD